MILQFFLKKMNFLAEKINNSEQFLKLEIIYYTKLELCNNKQLLSLGG